MVRRLLWSGLLVLLCGGAVAFAADYQVTVSVDAEGLRFLRRTYPGLDAEALRAKVGEVCSQRIQQAGARDISERLQKLEQKYRNLTPAQQAALTDALDALGD